MKLLSTLLTPAALTAFTAAQMSQPMVSENTIKIPDHVWAIVGYFGFLPLNQAVKSGGRSVGRIFD
jgi:hypothetical protein